MNNDDENVLGHLTPEEVKALRNKAIDELDDGSGVVTDIFQNLDGGQIKEAVNRKVSKDRKLVKRQGKAKEAAKVVKKATENIMNDNDAAASQEGVPSLGEARALRSDNAAHWTPRDTLMFMLKQINAGEITPDSLLIVEMERFKNRDGVEEMDYSFSMSGNNTPMEIAGILERLKLQMFGLV